MSDALHTHLTFGPRPGCPACVQTEIDLRLSGQRYRGRIRRRLAALLR